MEIKFQVRLIAAFFLFGLVVFSSFITISNVDRARLGVLQKPLDPTAHLSLAKFAAETSDWAVAVREFRLANQLFSQSDMKVAGITSYYQEVEQEVYASRYLTREISFWKQVLKEQPGYLDAHLNLSLVYYKTINDDLAREHWRQAWKIDPNDSDVMLIGNLLGVNQFGSVIN